MKNFKFKILGGDLTIEELLAIMVVGALTGLAVWLKQPELIKDFALTVGAFYFGVRKGASDIKSDEK